MSRRFPLALFVFAFLGWAFDFYDLVLLGFMKGEVGRSLGMTLRGEAWLLGVALGTSGVGGIVAGALADRYGKRSLLALTVLLYSVGSLICGAAASALVFFLGRAVVGPGVGGEWAIGHGMLAEAVEPRLRGRASAALQAGEPLGVALAAIVGYFVLPRVGWRWVLIGSSATALLALAVRLSTHLPAEPAKVRPTLHDLHAARVGSRMRRAWLLGVMKLGTYWSCYTWLPTFLLHQMGQSVGRSAAWMLTAQLGQFSGMIAFGKLHELSLATGVETASRTIGAGSALVGSPAYDTQANQLFVGSSDGKLYVLAAPL